ncbi:MAG: hypothetical protein J6Z22_00960, partial [Lachnospiraceae bacterium]|nr:hypothetical protein [Lachnospiraceae bacterium]
MRQVDKDLIYFTSCALQGIAPDATRLAAMDWDKVYECAKLHRMQSLIAYGLEPVSDKLPPEVW